MFGLMFGGVGHGKGYLSIKRAKATLFFFGDECHGKLVESTGLKQIQEGFSMFFGMFLYVFILLD